MIETITLYVILIAVCTSLAYLAQKTERFEYVAYAIIAYSILFSMRYGVGVDHLDYLHTYLLPPESTDRENLEIGFLAFMRGCQYINLHFTIFFGIIAFTQLYLIFRAIKDYRSIYTHLMTTFLVGCVWLSFSNGMRQILAFALFTYAITLIDKKKPIWHYICLIAACLIHKSAIILLPLYPLLRFRRIWFSNIKTQLILFGLAVSISILSINLLELFSTIISKGAELLGYDYYTQNMKNKLLYDENITIGLGFLINATIDFIIIFFSNKVKDEYKKTWMPVAYNLYFIGTLINYAIIRSHLVRRINCYFYGLDFIIGAFTLAYLYKEKKLFYFIILGLYIIKFIAVMSKMEQNTALFRFFWNYM